MLTLIFNIQPVEASGTIYIRADGSVEPDTAPISTIDNITYTFTDNIYDEIVVERDNVVVDGAGYTVQGAGSGVGIELRRGSVTLKNIKVTNFEVGIFLFCAHNNVLTGNTASSNRVYGIILALSCNNNLTDNTALNNSYGITVCGRWGGIKAYSNNNTISGNTITANNGHGIWLYESSSNIISGNNITENNGDAIRFDDSSHNSISGNNITNNWDGIVLDLSSNNTISGNNITENTYESIGLYSSSNDNSISENNVTANNWIGIIFWGSSNNTICGNIIRENDWDGIAFYGASSYNSISRNNITANTQSGIGLWDSSDNTISGNMITTNNQSGIGIYYSSNSIIFGNNITHNYLGIWLYGSSNNSMSGNNITANNCYGIELYLSSNCTVSGNHITENAGGTYPESGILLTDAIGTTIQHNSVSNNLGYGICVMWGSNNYILNNLVTHNVDGGVRIDGTEARALVANNTIEYNQPDGIFLYGAHDVLIENNTISNNKQAGITPQGESKNVTIRHNLIENNGWHGIFFYLSNCSLVEENVLRRNGFNGPQGSGIELHEHSNNITINGNDIIDNRYGIALVNSNNAKIYHNNLINNRDQIWIHRAYGISWDNGYPSGGNYWSDHVCTGNPSDGSQPYIIDENNMDRYPFQDPNGWLPKPEHELFVFLDVPTILILGHSSLLSATIYNRGLSNETNVELFLLINGAVVDSVTIPELVNGTSYTIDYLWTPIVEGIYNVTAYVPPVLGEKVTINNVNSRYVTVACTHYIRSDGSVDPDTTPISTVDNATYTFTGNIYGSIVIERDNIVVDGAGYTLQGTGSGAGIYLDCKSNVTIQNMEIKSFSYGIRLYESSNNTISGNNITENTEIGVALTGSSNNIVSGNNITGNRYGCALYVSSNNTISGGNIANNYIGIRLSGSGYNVIEGNTVNSSGFYGVQLVQSNDNEISSNEVALNGWIGIWTFHCRGNMISGNTVVSNTLHGIMLAQSNSTTVTDNRADNNDIGIELGDSFGNTVTDNIATNNHVGISLGGSSNNEVRGNTVTNNSDGIFIQTSSNNKIYHNNFINNARQVYSYDSINTWDDGYPSGGNFWSDYAGVDSNGDGIGDTPYVIDVNNQDRYPLMNPWGTGTPVANFTWTPSIPKVGESVAFDASSSTPNVGEIVSYEWNFGDDNYGSGKTVTHTYTSSGTYTVTLNVSDSEGLSDIEQKQMQVVQPHGPEADFTAIPDTALTGESIKFDASASLPGWNGTHTMPITEYRWDFADGNQTTTSTPIVYHSFSSSGIYYVTLTVYAPGATPDADSTTKKVTITAIPVGGYSFPINPYTTEKPLAFYLALVAILTTVSTAIKRKTHRRTKR